MNYITEMEVEQKIIYIINILLMSTIKLVKISKNTLI
jgi:hypothetical protein